MPSTKPFLLAICLACVLSGTSQAGDNLTAEQITTLISGNTIHARHLIKGFDFSVYFDADGKTAIRKQDGTETITSYRFQGDQHCIVWQGKDRCADIRDKGDGTYVRINAKGKEVVVWERVSPGRAL